MIEKVLHGILHQDCLAYIDDVVVFSRDESEHFDKLSRVFSKLREHNLKLKPSKCKLLQEEITYLGHCISAQGVRKDPEKTSKVTEWLVPTCVRDVRKFLGFSSYFRKYIKNYAKVAAPLSTLLQGYSNKRSNKKENRQKEAQLWQWTPECDAAFEELKRLLVEDVTLGFADFEKDFYLEVDACNTGLGAVLYQLDTNSKKRPIAYASRKTSRTEQGYSTHKLEFLGLKWAVTDKFKEYLYNGNKCFVFTDNNPLKFLLDKSKIDATSQRWCSELANYNLTVQYKSGVSNVAADALSRLHEDDNQLDEIDGIHEWCKNITVPVCTISTEDVCAVLKEYAYGAQPMVDAVMMSNLEGDHRVPTAYKCASIQTLKVDNDWSLLQKQDRAIVQVINILKNKKMIDRHRYKEFPDDLRALLRRRKDLHIEDEVLLLKRRIVASVAFLPDLMKCYHEAQGHMGEDRTIEIIESRFYWPKMRRNITDAVKQCRRCTLRKTLPAKNRTEMGHLMVAKHPFDILLMDHVSIDHRSTGTQKVLTVVDQFTKYAFFLHVTNEKAATTADKLMKEVFTKYGFCNTIHSDSGSAFVNKILKELTDMCGMKHTKSLPYNPQGNSTAERLNQTLLDMLGTQENNTKRKWKNHLSALQYAYNATVHSTTGYSPFFLMFGRQPRLVGDVVLNINKDKVYKTEYVNEVRRSLRQCYEKCREAMLKKGEVHKKYYDKGLPLLRRL